MKDNDEIDLAKDLMMDDEAVMTGSMARWLPKVVVFSALTGFVGLAWYAYHTGAQSLKEDDLVVVEADKTPMKEKPLDPGGMKFPNQDKTIFETFANNAQVPPKVEKLLPAPEEPMTKAVESSETKTFVNSKLQNNANGEQVIGDRKPEPDKPAVVATLDHAVTPADAKPAAPAPVTVTESPKIEEPVSSYTKSAAEPKPVEAKPTAAKPDRSVKVQLSAYRSEKEALAGWSKMQKQHSQLAGKSPVIVKADLGAKGTYYRLRVGGFADADAAKAFCSGLSAKGQSCIPAKD